MRRSRPAVLMPLLAAIVGCFLAVVVGADSPRPPVTLQGNAWLASAGAHVVVMVDVRSGHAEPDDRVEWVFVLQRKPSAPSVELPSGPLPARLQVQADSLRLRSPELGSDLLLIVGDSRKSGSADSPEAQVIPGIGLMYEEGQGRSPADCLRRQHLHWADTGHGS